MPGSSWFSKSGLAQEGRLAALGLPHGVTQRSLGDMKDSDRRREALRAAGLPGLVCVPRQVHGTEVLQARPGSAGRRAEGPTADGWIITEAGLCVGVFVADCLPVFLWDGAGGRAAGILHVGWRGAAAGMPKAGVQAFKRLGFAPEGLAAAIGPHIGPCCYRVGPELKARFRPESLREDADGLHLDLAAEARAQLVEAGMSPGSVSVSDSCTACRSEEFFSYRREKKDQRMLAFIALGGK